jgi:hypothetical protein
MSQSEGIDNDDYIYIKQEWDYSPHIDDRAHVHCHITRNKEQNVIIDFLPRKEEGVLLISGKRGVGKTSTLFSAVGEAIKILEKDKEKVVLPILINAPNFEMGKSKENVELNSLLTLKHMILQTLVRRLYQVAVKKDIITIIDDELVPTKRTRSKMLARLTKIKNNDKNNGNSALLAEDKNNIIRKKIHSLYRRAVAKEVREETNLKQIEQEKYYFEREKNFN